MNKNKMNIDKTMFLSDSNKFTVTSLPGAPPAASATCGAPLKSQKRRKDKKRKNNNNIK